MSLVDIVAILAIAQYIFFGVLVGGAREKYGVRAPAISGSEPFERVYRVHMNTLESLVALLPVMYIAARYWPAPYVAGAGAVYLVGRFVYWRAYVADPKRRSVGYFLTMMPVLVMGIGALIGAARALG
jgi:hypothetical protein